MSGTTPTDRLRDDDDVRTAREYIEAARAHHARTGEWPPDPLLEEVAEMRRQILAEHDNDWRKVMRWHIEQDKLFREQNPDARFLEKPQPATPASGR